MLNQNSCSNEIWFNSLQSISILRRKLDHNVHIVTHMKEKAAQITAKNHVQQKKLDGLDVVLNEVKLGGFAVILS